MAGMSVCKQRRRNLRSASAGESDEEKAPELEEDVRDFRAKLIAQEWKGRGGLAADAMKSGSGWIYETPLIEKGAVLLGGTRQRFGFGIRQQYFHKCVLLLIQHDNFFTKGIILNRPSAKKYQGWDVWFGGDVQEGGMFRSHFPQDSGPQNLLPEVSGNDAPIFS